MATMTETREQIINEEIAHIRREVAEAIDPRNEPLRIANIVDDEAAL